MAYPLMYLIEKTFGFISDVTLFELSDTNKSLIREMSEIAPGTFQHSITVGTSQQRLQTGLERKANWYVREHSIMTLERCLTLFSSQKTKLE